MRRVTITRPSGCRRLGAGAGVGAIVVSGLLVAACGSSSNASTTSTTRPQAKAVGTVIKTTHSKLGTILVASNGRTLYLFEKDTGSASTCYGACAAGWPPVTTNGAPSASGGADSSLLGVTARSDGTSQVTYAGHPLYFFSGDSAPGQVTGEELSAFGAKWYVLAPSGHKVENG